MPRDVHLVLLDESASGAGPPRPLGVLGPLPASSPYWPDVEPVVEAARERCGVDVLVLRVLPAVSMSDPDGPPTLGGHVVYLAQARRPLTSLERAALSPVGDLLDDDALAAALADHPLRAPYARPGGPASVIAWADDALAAAGRHRTGPVEQVKTWNLSSVLRLPTASGPVWCKSVPRFFAHEGPVIRRVAQAHPALVPHVIAHDPASGTVLLADVPGEDQWTAPLHRLLSMVEAVVGLQAEWAGSTGELLALGLPDWRGPSLARALAGLVARDDVRGELAVDELARLDALVAGLPELAERLAACGLPDSLVHGDLHPGNWRHGPGGLLLLDWGDSGVGHPLLDQPAFLSRVPDADRPDVLAAWRTAWAARYPAADVALAAELVRPLAALRQALIYRTFLDRIEPDERVYHQHDVPDWLRRALALERT